MSSAVSHNIDDYESLLVALQNELGVVVPESMRSNILERLGPLLAENNIDSLPVLAEKLREDGEVRSNVLDAISRRQTSWSLGVDMKKVLQEYIFSRLPDNARIWLVGCGQGQLAYSIAMEFAEHEANSGNSKNIRLIATDVSRQDIRQAESGVYSSQQLLTLADSLKKSYTTTNAPDDNGQVKQKIRQLMSFSQCDLNEDFQSLGEMDLIVCPEVLTYFSNGRKAGIIRQFSSLLKPGGIFLPGSNQSMPAEQGLERVDHSTGVFYRKKS